MRDYLVRYRTDDGALEVRQVRASDLPAVVSILRAGVIPDLPHLEPKDFVTIEEVGDAQQQPA